MLLPGDSLHVAAAMMRVQTLDTVNIAGQGEPPVRLMHAGFERRRLLGQGRFVTPEELERTPSISIGDVLRHVPSIKVSADAGGILAIESMRGMRLDRNARPVPCRVRVVVDGFLMPLNTPLPVQSPREVYGIEVYAGPATIPREFARLGEDTFCGMVLIWRK